MPTRSGSNGREPCSKKKSPGKKFTGKNKSDEIEVKVDDILDLLDLVDELATDIHLMHLQILDPELTPLLTQVKVEWKTLLKSPYVALVGAIVGQQIRYRQARVIRSRIYTILGTNFSCSDFSALTQEDLLGVGLSSGKIAIINRVNVEILMGASPLTLSGLHQLESISGIGPWTIQTTLLSAGLDWDVFPPRDVFLRKRIQKLYGLAKPPTFSEMEKISQRWRPYRGIVCWYLWRWFE